MAHATIPMPDLSAHELDLQRLAAKPQGDQHLELAVYSIPLPLSEEGGRPFEPEIILMALGGQLLFQYQTQRGMCHRTIPEVLGAILGILVNLPQKPSAIWVSTPSSLAALTQICQVADIPITTVDELPVLDQVWEAFMDTLDDDLEEDE